MIGGRSTTTITGVEKGLSHLRVKSGGKRPVPQSRSNRLNVEGATYVLFALDRSISTLLFFSKGTVVGKAIDIMHTRSDFERAFCRTSQDGSGLNLGMKDRRKERLLFRCLA